MSHLFFAQRAIIIHVEALERIDKQRHVRPSLRTLLHDLLDLVVLGLAFNGILCGVVHAALDDSEQDGKQNERAEQVEGERGVSTYHKKKGNTGSEKKWQGSTS